SWFIVQQSFPHIVVRGSIPLQVTFSHVSIFAVVCQESSFGGKILIIMVILNEVFLQGKDLFGKRFHAFHPAFFHHVVQQYVQHLFVHLQGILQILKGNNEIKFI